MRALFKRLRGDRGQGLSEYAIIVALIAIASIVVITAFGDQIREIFFKSGQQLSGDEGAQVEDQMGGATDAVNQSIDDWN